MTNRTTHKTLMIILSIVGAAGFLTVLACGGLIYWGVGTMADLRKAQVDADACLDLLGAEKVDEAYAATAPAFRAKVDPEQFRKQIEQYPAVTKQTRRSMGGMRMFFGSTGPRALIQYNIANPNNTLSLMLSMVKADGRWKVESVNLP